MEPFLSIVIATFQAEKELTGCLASIVSQENSSWELLVADGGSDDGTVAIIKSFESHIQWFRSAPDSGIYDAWNSAIDRCRGRYVMFLGADDRLATRQSLTEIIGAAQTSGADLVTSKGVLIGSNGESAVEIGRPFEWRRFGRRMMVCHPGMLHARDLFFRFGRFDPTFRICGDLDFLLRLPESTSSFHVDRVTVLIGSSGVSRSRVVERLREQRRALAKSPRFGPLIATLIWADRAVRALVARALRLPF